MGLERYVWRQRSVAYVAALSLGLGAGATHAQFHGFYVDEPSYEPGQTVDVHASAPGPLDVKFRLIRHGVAWTEVALSPTVNVKPQTTRIGSFIEAAPGQDLLGGRTAFTLEGWFYPTLVGGDDVAVAGQLGATQASAAIGVLPDGRPFGYVSSSASLDPAKRLVAGAPLAVDEWHHLALTYDAASGEVAFFVTAKNRSEVVAGQAAGPVASTALPFRLGARAEAPGDLTGIIDGRLDSWSLWPRVLTRADVQHRANLGRSALNPAPAPADVELFLGFEDAYGALRDASRHAHPVRVVNHGTPRVAGVHPDGVAFRLNHDQLVDARWPVTASLTIPPDAPSGLYSIQALIGPQYTDNRSSDLVRMFAVRPRAPTPGTSIAVVLPTNTWLAYSDFPGRWNDTAAIPGITSRRRTPTSTQLLPGGNNSAYGFMGDGVSVAWFQGWRRPAGTSSAIGGGPGGYSNKGAQSYFLAQWLSREGLAYDVYSDLDLGTGRFPPQASYRVLIPHGHHEYWSQQELDAVQAFQAAGGSVVSVAGNAILWRVSHAADGANEVRKWPTFVPLGRADFHNAVDQARAGHWLYISICRGDPLQHLVTGSLVHSNLRCGVECYGRWQVMNSQHWLWGKRVSDGELVGASPLSGVYTVGHEADTFVPGIPPPGLAPGTTPTVLAEGVGFTRPEIMGINFPYPLAPGQTLPPPPTCEQVESTAGLHLGTAPVATAATRTGSILYFRHRGGGHVLSVGAVAAPWSLLPDAAMGGLVKRALECFALERGCPPEESVDAGPPALDAGAAAGDAGTGEVDAGTPTDEAPTRPACGCGTSGPVAVGGAALLWLALGALGLAARGRPRSSSCPGPSDENSRGMSPLLARSQDAICVPLWARRRGACDESVLPRCAGLLGVGCAGLPAAAVLGGHRPGERVGGDVREPPLRRGRRGRA